MRLFVAIRPSEEAVEHLDAFLDVRREVAGPRWSAPDQWHLTLAFAGDFPERALDDLEQGLEQVAARRAPMRARLAGGGAFPGPAQARVLWLGVDTDHEALDRLAAGARTAVTRAGGRVDAQRFRPHLTLGRFGRPTEATRWIRLLDSYDGPTWELGEIELVASYLGEARRPRHEVLASFSLGSDPDSD